MVSLTVRACEICFLNPASTGCQSLMVLLHTELYLIKVYTLSGWAGNWALAADRQKKRNSMV